MFFGEVDAIAGSFLELQMFFGEVNAIAGPFLSCKFSLQE